MYKVVLVDDEQWTLRGIRETFRWEEYGFEVIKKTTRPVEALDFIIREKPDVVFTDIRMPKIFGIELMQKVREVEYDTEFVVISGFGEFSYAQEAIRQGVVENDGSVKLYYGASDWYQCVADTSLDLLLEAALYR